MKLLRRVMGSESHKAARLPGRGWTTAAYWALWGVLVVLYLAWPLAHLDVYHWANDEGLYMQRAALANARYPLYTEVFRSSKPLTPMISG